MPPQSISKLIERIVFLENLTKELQSSNNELFKRMQILEEKSKIVSVDNCEIPHKNDSSNEISKVCKPNLISEKIPDKFKEHFALKAPVIKLMRIDHSIVKKGQQEIPIKRSKKSPQKGIKFESKQGIKSRKVVKECPRCWKVFLDFSKLSNHLKTHTAQNPYSCKVCDLPFQTLEELKAHFVEKYFQCTICSKIFAVQCALKLHERVHEESPKKDIKKFECGLCHRVFTQESNLEHHIRTHTNEKPFKCTITHCGHEFTSSSALAKHIHGHE